MPHIDPTGRTRELAEGSVVSGDPIGWFEQLYADARLGQATVPWDRGAPHPMLVEWADQEELDGTDQRALIVGCGLGGDSEFIASCGFETVAFDIAPSGIRAVKDRFPKSQVEYRVANVLEPPGAFRSAFDLVIEIFTVQALPVRLRTTATKHVSSFVAPGGRLIVIAAAREASGEILEGPPWPLTRAEIDGFACHGLVPVQIEHLEIAPTTGDFRWRADFARPHSYRELHQDGRHCAGPTRGQSLREQADCRTIDDIALDRHGVGPYTVRRRCRAGSWRSGLRGRCRVQ